LLDVKEMKHRDTVYINPDFYRYSTHNICSIDEADTTRKMKNKKVI